MIRIATARNYALVAMLMTGGALVAGPPDSSSTSTASGDTQPSYLSGQNNSNLPSLRPRTTSPTFSKTDTKSLYYSTLDFAAKREVRRQLDKVFDKDAVIETTIGDIPYCVLSKTTLSRSTVDAAKVLAHTQNSGEAAKELVASAVASEVVEILGVATTHGLNVAGSAANMVGIHLFDNFRENHPEIARGTWAVTSYVAHMSAKGEIRKKMN